MQCCLFLKETSGLHDFEKLSLACGDADPVTLYSHTLRYVTVCTVEGPCVIGSRDNAATIVNVLSPSSSFVSVRVAVTKF